MIREWSADYIEKKVREGHELHTVKVNFTDRRHKWTAVRKKLRETHPHLVVTPNETHTFPAFLNERKQPDGSYEITVLTHQRIRGQTNAPSIKNWRKEL